MTIKKEIKVDKEKKVLTLLVTVPRKKFARDENLSFSGDDAWEAVKNYGVSGHKVVEKRSGLVVDNWRRCNHSGEYCFTLVEDAQKAKAKVKSKPKQAKNTPEEKDPAPSIQKSKVKK